jgi:hypothetical protein
MKLDSIEDCLEVLAGMRQAPKFDIIKEDHTIITSIARQCFKGTALTDRQFNLMKEKLQSYKDQFEANDYNTFDVAVESLRQPLRHIDRSKYIKIIKHLELVGPNSVYESYKEKWLWIKVRFPFSKKLIVDLQSIKCPEIEHVHKKGSHEHFFFFTERNVYQIVELFKDKNFDIDKELLEYYNKVNELTNEAEHAPSIVDFKFKNIHPRAQKLAINELGSPNADNIVRYKDRKDIYGIKYFDSALEKALNEQTILTQKVVKRKSHQVFIKNTKWTFDSLVRTLIELDRFPLAILVDENDPYDDLVTTHKAFKNLFMPDEISVQFRLGSDKSQGFNEYIKDQGLNTPVDKTTKIVYTSIDKLNKPLISSECKPRTALLLDSRRYSLKVSAWLEEFDLVIHYDENMSQFMRFRDRKLTEV